MCNESKTQKPYYYVGWSCHLSYEVYYPRQQVFAQIK